MIGALLLLCSNILRSEQNNFSSKDIINIQRYNENKKEILYKNRCIYSVGCAGYNGNEHKTILCKNYLICRNYKSLYKKDIV
jgi:hypothetical protein